MWHATTHTWRVLILVAVHLNGHAAAQLLHTSGPLLCRHRSAQPLLHIHALVRLQQSNSTQHDGDHACAQNSRSTSEGKMPARQANGCLTCPYIRRLCRLLGCEETHDGVAMCMHGSAVRAFCTASDILALKRSSFGGVSIASLAATSKSDTPSCACTPAVTVKSWREDCRSLTYVSPQTVGICGYCQFATTQPSIQKVHPRDPSKRLET